MEFSAEVQLINARGGEGERWVQWKTELEGDLCLVVRSLYFIVVVSEGNVEVSFVSVKLHLLWGWISRILISLGQREVCYENPNVEQTDIQYMRENAFGSEGQTSGPIMASQWEKGPVGRGPFNGPPKGSCCKPTINMGPLGIPSSWLCCIYDISNSAHVSFHCGYIQRS